MQRGPAVSSQGPRGEREIGRRSHSRPAIRRNRVDPAVDRILSVPMHLAEAPAGQLHNRDRKSGGGGADGAAECGHRSFLVSVLM